MNELVNHTFDEIRVGDTASLRRTLSAAGIQLLAAISREMVPADLTADGAGTAAFDEVLAHGGWAGGLLAAAIGTAYPGAGSSCLRQNLEFLAPARLGTVVTIDLSVIDKEAQQGTVLLRCQGKDQDGSLLFRGEAQVRAPRSKITLAALERPEIRLLERDLRFGQILARVRGLAPVRMAIVHPCESEALMGALEAARQGLIEPVLVGPAGKIRAVAELAGADLTGLRIEDVPHSHAAAARAVALARSGDVGALMKGSLHTDELMSEVVRTEGGLRTGRRVSHVFLMDVPAYPRLLMITDAAINIAPDLDEKRDIVQNAIELAQALGIVQPRVAVLAAVETVSEKMRSTLDAAALCKMADRGQIHGGLIDGPLAFDNAISAAAAKSKDIHSEVAGQADILVVPDLEAGNMLAKQLQYLAGAQAAGIVLGARVPIVLTSRADSRHERAISCAVAQLLRHSLAAPAA